MSDTPNLSLPEIAESQDNKEVTHNEALQILDALVQLTVLDRDLTAPPGGESEGDRYLVAAGATGAWSGQSGKIAYYRAGGWLFFAPQEGWRAWVADEDVLLAYDGSSWAESGGGSIAVEDQGALTVASATTLNFVGAGVSVTDAGAGEATVSIPGGGGGGGGVNNIYAHVRMSGNQSLSGGSTTVMVFGNVIEDGSGLWDAANNHFLITPELNGKLVLVAGNIQHTADGSGSLETFIEISTDGGSSWSRVAQSPNGAVDNWGISEATALVRVSTGDRIRLRQFTSSSKTVSAGAQGTFFKLVALDTAAVSATRAVNAQTGTSYTLAVSDEGDVVTMDNPSPNTVTIPANAAAAIATGSEITIIQTGTGATTVQAAAGVSLRGVSEGSAALSGQWARVDLIKIGTDEWAMNGDHGAVS